MAFFICRLIRPLKLYQEISNQLFCCLICPVVLISCFKPNWWMARRKLEEVKEKQFMHQTTIATAKHCKIFIARCSVDELSPPSPTQRNYFNACVRQETRTKWEEANPQIFLVAYSALEMYFGFIEFFEILMLLLYVIFLVWNLLLRLNQAKFAYYPLQCGVDGQSPCCWIFFYFSSNYIVFFVS